MNEDSYHFSFYDYQCNVCFYNRKLQKYRIYLDLHNIYEDLRKAVGDDSMSFTFNELLIWARPLVMVIDHCNKTLETMEVIQNEWEAKGHVKIAPFHKSIEINSLKRKLEMLTMKPDDTTVQKIDLEMEITRLEPETLKERKQRKEKEKIRRRKRGSKRMRRRR